MVDRSRVSDAICVVAAVTIGTSLARARGAKRAPGVVRLGGGSFVQGHDDGDRTDESPAHRVTVRPFAIDATLVTRADFARFVQKTGYRTTAEEIGFGMASHEGMRDWQWDRVQGATWRRPFAYPSDVESNETLDADTRGFLRDDAPVVMVSWFDAVAYCKDQGKRLPTEAEWDYAMRAGSSGTRFPWGEDPIRDGKLGLNYWQGASHDANRRDDGFVYVSPVRAFSPNAWGIYDAVGNVWQWVADVYDENAYEHAALHEEAANLGESEDAPHVLRGGSWWCGACTCEGNGLWYRGKANPRAPFNNNGFRCAASL